MPFLSNFNTVYQDLKAVIRFHVEFLSSVDGWKKEKRLRHLGVPQYVGSGTNESSDLRFMAMPKFGTDLQKLFEENGKRFPENTVYNLALQLVSCSIFQMQSWVFIHSQHLHYLNEVWIWKSCSFFWSAVTPYSHFELVIRTIFPQYRLSFIDWCLGVYSWARIRSCWHQSIEYPSGW